MKTQEYTNLRKARYSLYEGNEYKNFILCRDKLEETKEYEERQILLKKKKELLKEYNKEYNEEEEI